MTLWVPIPTHSKRWKPAASIWSSTMPQDGILNGRLIGETGAAPVRPEGFVIFRITRITQSATW